MPITGRTMLVATCLAVRNWRRRTANQASTDRFTAVNAMRAPKLIMEETSSRLGVMASSETRPTATVAYSGVWRRGCT